MKALIWGLGLLAGVSGTARAELVDTTLRFESGADRACNFNCLYVSVNEGKFEKLGCNKVRPGRCVSPGGLRSQLAVKLHDDRCNRLRFQLVSQSKDGGPWFRSFISTDPNLFSGQGYHIVNRTPHRVEFWLNDNSDDDFKDFRGTVSVAVPLTVGVDHLVGAGCP